MALKLNLSAISGVLNTLRGIAHDATVVVAGAAASVGAIVSGLNAVGIHVSSAELGHFLLIAGSAVALVSRGITVAEGIFASKTATAAVTTVVNTVAPKTPAQG